MNTKVTFRSLTLVSALSLAPLLSLAACGGDPGAAPQPVDSVQLPVKTAARVRAIVSEAGGGLQVADDDNFVPRRIGSAAVNVGVSVSKVMPKAVPAPMRLIISPTPALRAQTSAMPSMMTTQEQFDETAEDLRVLLEERIMAPANVESKTDTQVVYKLNPDTFCLELPSKVVAPATPKVDASCKSDLSKLETRVAMTADGDGARLALLMGPSRLEMSAFIVHSDLFAWEADLPQAKAAAAYVSTALATDKKSDLPEFTKLSGRVQASMKLNGTKNVTFAFKVLEAIEVQPKDDAGDPGNFKMGTADPLVAFTLDGVAKSVTAQWGLPKTDVAFPWDPQNTGAKNLDAVVSIGGFTGSTTVASNADDMRITGLGLGASYFAVRGKHVVDVDTNTFDLVAKALGDDQARFEVSPKFLLNVGVHLAEIKSEMKDPPADWVLNDTFGAELSGATPAIIESIPETATFPGGFKVVSGGIKISAASKPAETVNVPTGMCLTSNKTPASGGHPLLSALTSSTCP